MFAVAPEDRHDALPADPCGTAVLLLAGSSGRVERERADLLAAHGARVRTIRWFGGAGQRPAPHEVPLELFVEQVDRLRAECERVLVFGTSFGAEPALCTACVTPVDGVIAFAPSSVVWPGVLDGDWSSHWTHRGAPLPFVPFAPGWQPDEEPPSFRSLYEESLRRAPESAAAARIPVEQIVGEVVLVAGDDDRVWPAAEFAARIRASRDEHGLRTTLVSRPDAGHRAILPGEQPAFGGVGMAHGGTPEADAALGAAAWPHIVRLLGLQPESATVSD
ncbi:alpha/beta fold hydrolase [Microbacterium sp.]|uniref:alpha/beta fold hydrolase n=1 Tax=Microbacterium sp. TaxID=51671 RepID=UPI002810A9CD|nr:acyl-CoA thioester hydrolase/BAAT C-terminal domain-containing protein [Microbacterium sp.]